MHIKKSQNVLNSKPDSRVHSIIARGAESMWVCLSFPQAYSKEVLNNFYSSRVVFSFVHMR